jgi:hypothetical protein
MQFAHFRLGGAMKALGSSALSFASTLTHALLGAKPPQERHAQRRRERLAHLKRTIEEAAARPPATHRSRHGPLG